MKPHLNFLPGKVQIKLTTNKLLQIKPKQMKATVDRTKKMQTRCLVADWDPRPDYKLGSRDIEGKLTYLGSKVWRNPRIESVDKDIPVPGPEDILV